jgi:Ser/Thr protein kinase RdoA (MazF antagonist)
MSLRTQAEKEYAMSFSRPVGQKDVFLLQAGSGQYCLKSYQIPEEEMRFLASVFERLRESGFQQAPVATRTVSGEVFFLYKGSRYMLTPWIAGRAPDFSRGRELKKALRTLARFHLHARGLPPEQVPASRIRVGEIRKNLTDYPAALQRRKRLTPLMELCREAEAAAAHPDFQNSLDKELQAGAFIHGDYNYPNLVLDPSRKLHLIDFENCSLQSRMEDLSHILHRNAPFQASRMLKLVESYDRIRPLDAGDRRVLYVLLLLPYPAIRAMRQKKKKSFPNPPDWKKLSRYLKDLSALID